jgi:hypothetical protein
MKKNKVNIKFSSKLSTPSTEVLEKAGWTVEATPDPKKTENPLADDGRKASDEPSNQKVLADQKSPVTSGTKEAETVIRREEIIERGDSVEESTEDVSSDPFGSSDSSNVFAALRVAELEEQLGLDNKWEVSDKFARIATLEELSLERLNERISTLQTVKEAGLSNRSSKKVAQSSLPRIASLPSLEKTSSNEEIPDEAIF